MSGKWTQGQLSEAAGSSRTVHEEKVPVSKNCPQTILIE